MGLFGPSFDELWSGGEASTGTLVGIRRFERSSDETTVEFQDYAVQLADGTLVGVRQRLAPRDEVRLGMPVTVARRKKAVVIRWGQKASGDWKTVAPPPLGILDEVAMRGVRAGWTPVELEIVGFGARSAMLGLTSVTQAHVNVHGDGFTAVAAIDKWAVPFYASHLGAVGSRLPGLRHPRDPGVVRVDWPSAIAADPGLGAPPLAGGGEAAGAAAGVGLGAGGPSAGLPGMLDAFQQRMTEKAMAAVTGGAAVGPAEEDPVSWERYLAASVAIKNEPGTPPDVVAQRLGFAPGEWDEAHRRWLARMMSDWRLGAAYGQALS